MRKLKGKNPSILVVGDLMLDHYLWGRCERISPEAPVQVVEVQKESKVLGGAGNVINNLKTLGANVEVISVIGDDLIANQLINQLNIIGVDTSMLIIDKDRKTSIKTRVIASNQQVIRYDNESKNDINLHSQKKIIKLFKNNLSKYDVILLSDYGKGVLTEYLTKEFIKLSNSNNKKVLVDPKGNNYKKYSGAYLLTPNKKEAINASKIQIKDNESLKKAIFKLKYNFNLKISLITLSEGGIAIYDDKLRIYPTKAKEVYDVTGAGDTVLASLGFSLACGVNIDEAIKFTNFAAGIVVGKLGSSTVTFKEIEDRKNSLKTTIIESKIKTFNQINLTVKKLKNKGKKIVFTNGCFDIFHIGHVKYLEKASVLGDILIVGLNSDSSVKKIKGKERPIYNENDRAYLLASLNFVDYVVVFNEDSPYNLIKSIVPDLLVKGGDYDINEIIGNDIAKKTKVIKFVDGKSTSIIIKKIQCLK